uniref:Uncharacterized protein LOC104234176 n=1 Tax=Nicotiana sylvestris TaxID=4096 RepID=A0A1U7X582_NICSY|nr:PREDICTED: uncharacterized protein LOC104234176 [Nicotiana sylvestris]
MEVHQFASLGVRLADSSEGEVIVQNRVESSLVVEAIQRPIIVGLRERIMDEAHSFRYSMHLGSTKMYHDLKKVYWWNNMKRNVADFVTKCPNYQQVKAEHQRPDGLAQNIEIPTWKWEMINMDFVVGLPRTPRMFDSIWVIVDQLTKSAQFLPIKTTNTVEPYAQLYINEKVNLSIAFHPQIDWQAERTIQTVTTQIGKSQRAPEFSYNNSSHASIQMAPFEALYGRRYRSLIGWFKIREDELIGTNNMHRAMEKVKIIKKRLKTA